MTISEKLADNMEICVCPFCKKKDRMSVRESNYSGDSSIQIMCDSCGTDGPTGDSLDSAIYGWNQAMEES